MRALGFVLVACACAVGVPLAIGTACSPPSSSAAQPYDVYVPGLADGGDASLPEAGEGGFGLGQVDRAGRPLVSVLLVPTGLQDEYNEQPSFEATQPRALQDGIESRLVELDTLTLGDGGPDPVDWPVGAGAQGTTLLPMFVGDTLFVDTGKSCTSEAGAFLPSYLDIEREIVLSGPRHSTCGGRTPSENVVDKTLQLLVTADREGGPSVSQGVGGPTKPATTTFPYLAAPN